MKILKKFFANRIVKRLLCAACASACLLSSAFAFEPSTAISYADKFALSPNSGYHYYLRGDCTNFVSQCLYSGKLTKEPGVWEATLKSDGKYWGLETKHDTYPSPWTVANSLKEYLKTRGAKKIGSWMKKADISGFASYVDNSANLTNSNKGRTVIFYDWKGDWEIDHAALFVADNQKTQDTKEDGNVTGDLIDQHTADRKRVIWHGDNRNKSYRDTTLIYAFELPR